ncbi:MAG: PQQ-dependent sugar dehydrogenase [Myxococcota bacterium]
MRLALAVGIFLLVVAAAQWWLARDPAMLIALTDAVDSRESYARSGGRLERAFPRLRFDQPVAMVQTPSEPDRWFLLEQTGRVRSFANQRDADEAPVLLDLSRRLAGPEIYAELGLLGIALHPEWSKNKHLYLFYTSGVPVQAHEEGRVLGLFSRLSRFTLDDRANVIDPRSEKPLLILDQPTVYHKGGTLVFGPNGYLYVSLGEGGVPENSSDTTTLLGSILRIAVDTRGRYGVPKDNPFVGRPGRPEIYAWGLRNPWKISFDRATGLLWTGDAGDVRFEEVDRIQKGRDYGWPFMEGPECTRFADPCDPDAFVAPVASYTRSGGCAIIGGTVYRGSRIPQWQGLYLYGDHCTGKVAGVMADPPFRSRHLFDTNMVLSSFAEDLDGELYLLAHERGEIYRIVPEPGWFYYLWKLIAG